MLIAPSPQGAHWDKYVQIRYIFVPMATVASWCKEHAVKNILLTISFVELGKRRRAPIILVSLLLR
jgi:hypothetical protein